MMTEERMSGLCAGCYEVQEILIGELKCDYCRAVGGPYRWDPEPYPRKSGPNSVPEE